MKYAQSHGIEFKCFYNIPEIDYMSERFNSRAFRTGVYASIYAVYEFLKTNHERMIWTDLDTLFLFKDNVFDRIPNMYFENGLPEGKVYSLDCPWRTKKIEFIKKVLGLDYTVLISAGIFSMDRYHAEKFVKYVEKYYNLYDKQDLDKFCNFMNENDWLPNDEMFLEAFAIENNITPKKVLFTRYVARKEELFEEWDCDIVHFHTKWGKEVLNEYLEDNNVL